MEILQDKLPEHLAAWRHLFVHSTAAAVAIRDDDGAILALSPGAAVFLDSTDTGPGNSRAREEFVARVREAANGQRAPAFRWTRIAPGNVLAGADVRVARITSGTSSVLLARLYPASKTQDNDAGFHHMMNLLDAILGAQDHREALRILLRELASHQHWDYAEAWLPGTGDEHLSPAMFHWNQANPADPATHVEAQDVTRGETLVGRAWQSGVPEWLPDMRAALPEDLPRRDELLARELRSAYALPLLHEQRVVCVLQFFFRQVTHTDLELLDALARIANLLAMALERTRIESSLFEREALMQSLFSNLPCSVYRRVLNADGSVSYPYVGGRLLPSLGIHTGSRHASIQDALRIVHASDREAFVREISRSARDRSPLNVDYRVAAEDGTTRWLRTYSMPGMNDDGTISWDCFAIDVTEEKRLRQLAEEQERRDPVTRLPTRQVFDTQLPAMLAATKRHGEKLAVLFFNIDRFRWINDAYGMAGGDAVLAAVAERLQETLPMESLYARIASDEFAVAIGALKDEQELRRHLAVLQRVMQKPFRVLEQDVILTYTTGLCVYPDDCSEASGMLRCASLALHRGRRENKSKLTRFARERDQESAAVIDLERELRVALRDRQLEVHYQPQVAPGFDSLVGFEALVRWRHPERGMVPPNRFIPIAEESGLIDEIFLYVLDAVCGQYEQWQRAGLHPPAVSVNLSPVQMRLDNRIAADVARILQKRNVPPGCLKLEITEGTLLRNFETGLALVNDLGKLGVAVVLDDFGVGYSSLGYLAQLPVRSIKIDRSFVTGLDRNVNAAKVLRAVITLAHSLSMEVTVEGVETDAQLETIRQWQCHGIQGFIFSKPLPGTDATSLLEKML